MIPFPGSAPSVGPYATVSRGTDSVTYLPALEVPTIPRQHRSSEPQVVSSAGVMSGVCQVRSLRSAAANLCCRKPFSDNGSNVGARPRVGDGGSLVA